MVEPQHTSLNGKGALEERLSGGRVALVSEQVGEPDLGRRILGLLTQLGLPGVDADRLGPRPQLVDLLDRAGADQPLAGAVERDQDEGGAVG
jgi:hypothetical protein